MRVIIAFFLFFVLTSSSFAQQSIEPTAWPDGLEMLIFENNHVAIHTFDSLKCIHAHYHEGIRMVARSSNVGALKSGAMVQSIDSITYLNIGRNSFSRDTLNAWRPMPNRYGDMLDPETEQAILDIVTAVEVFIRSRGLTVLKLDGPIIIVEKLPNGSVFWKVWFDNRFYHFYDDVWKSDELKTKKWKGTDDATSIEIRNVFY